MGTAPEKVWSGKVPVRFSLASREVTAMQAPLPVFKLLPRISYLPLVSTAVSDHFINSAPAVRGDMWFDIDGRPLKWHYPIGVLFDLLRGKENNGGPTKIPLDITVHFTGFPSKELLPCRSLHAVNERFFHSLKEGCFLKYGSSSIIMNMSKSLHQKIEQSLVSGDYKLFEEASRMWKSEAKNGVQRLPIRFMLGNGFDASIKNRMLQPSLSPRSSEGVTHTLRSSIKAVLSNVDMNRIYATIHGINPPLDTSMMWLAENMCHADQFLYVCLSLLDEPEEMQNKGDPCEGGGEDSKMAEKETPDGEL